MNVTELCPTCYTNQRCDCKNSLIRFFDLFEVVSKRVLSTNTSSIIPSIEPSSVGIDKLNGYFTNSIHISSVCNAALFNKWSTQKVFLKDRSPYLAITNQKQAIHLKLDYSQTIITGFVANPNHFNSWPDFKNFFKSASTIEDFNQCQISRLDLNIDYNLSFQEFLTKLDITNKRASLSFIDNGGERTGLIVGKGNETIAVYDKAKESNLDTPSTRVEIRLKQNKLPTKNIEDLSSTLMNGSFFKNIEIVALSYHQPKLEDQIERLNKFKNICNREGYFLAGKSQSKLRNFDRDFKNLISVAPNATQPNEQFKRHIGDYINPNKEQLYV